MNKCSIFTVDDWSKNDEYFCIQCIRFIALIYLLSNCEVIIKSTLQNCTKKEAISVKTKITSFYMEITGFERSAIL